MKYKVLLKNSINADGIGYPSISLYYGGCDKYDHHNYFCKNCQNIELQDKNVNIPEYYNEELYRYIIQFISDWSDFCENLAVSFIGGEPLSIYNRESVLYLSKKIKENYKNIKTVLYTWRTLEDIKSQGLEDHVSYIDSCIMGEYNHRLIDEKYLLGSTNQYIYNFVTDTMVLQYNERI